MIKKPLKQKKSILSGFTLVETLVAVSIFSISILGLLVILSGGVANTNYAKRKLTASFLAQEGIEYIRNMRDNYVLYSATTSNDWTSFKAELSSCSELNPCGFDPSLSSSNPAFIFGCSSSNCNLYFNNGGYDASGGEESGFVREIWMTAVGADQVKIYSSVSWVQGSGDYEITFQEDLFNWAE